GSVPTTASKKYNSPLTVNTTTTIKAIAVNNKAQSSYVTTAKYWETPHDWNITLNTKYEHEYTAGGDQALIDGIRGEADWRKGNWQGYQNVDMDVTIDMKSQRSISTVTGGFLQDTRSWIIVPRQFIIEVSTDGKQYSQVYMSDNFLPIEDMNVQVKQIVAKFSPVTARYVRIKAIQYGALPSWHESAGSPSHLFVDELNIQ
ncbi:MAG TPA: FN3 associated domain-containing protein, partial [Ferruginibacter sp.]|nr:FN3 associated domain-containing protein [Ferruginibacter sp.]